MDGTLEHLLSNIQPVCSYSTQKENPDLWKESRRCLPRGDICPTILLVLDSFPVPLLWLIRPLVWHQEHQGELSDIPPWDCPPIYRMAGPFYAIFLVILVASIVIAIKVRRDVHVWEGTIDPQAQARKQEIKKEVKPLLWYPIVYLVLKTSLLISHIYDAARPHSPAVSVWLLQALSTPLAGALIALVYTMDRETRNRMKPSLVKASCKGFCCAMCRKGSGVKDYAVNPLEFGDSLGDVRYYEVMDRIDDRHQSTTAVATCRL